MDGVTGDDEVDVLQVAESFRGASNSQKEIRIRNEFSSEQVTPQPLYGAVEASGCYTYCAPQELFELLEDQFKGILVLNGMGSGMQYAHPDRLKDPRTPEGAKVHKICNYMNAEYGVASLYGCTIMPAV